MPTQPLEKWGFGQGRYPRLVCWVRVVVFTNIREFDVPIKVAIDMGIGVLTMPCLAIFLPFTGVSDAYKPCKCQNVRAPTTQLAEKLTCTVTRRVPGFLLANHKRRRRILAAQLSMQRHESKLCRKIENCGTEVGGGHIDALGGLIEEVQPDVNRAEMIASGRVLAGYSRLQNSTCDKASRTSMWRRIYVSTLCD